MLTDEERKLFKEAWYTFEEIQQISDSDDAVSRWEVISEEAFWSDVHKKMNDKMKEKCI